MIKKYNLDRLNRFEIQENKSNLNMENTRMSMIFDKFCIYHRRKDD